MNENNLISLWENLEINKCMLKAQVNAVATVALLVNHWLWMVSDHQRPLSISVTSTGLLHSPNTQDLSNTGLE